MVGIFCGCIETRILPEVGSECHRKAKAIFERAVRGQPAEESDGAALAALRDVVAAFDGEGHLHAAIRRVRKIVNAADCVKGGVE